MASARRPASPDRRRPARHDGVDKIGELALSGSSFATGISPRRRTARRPSAASHLDFLSGVIDRQVAADWKKRILRTRSR